MLRAAFFCSTNTNREIKQSLDHKHFLWLARVLCLIISPFIHTIFDSPKHSNTWSHFHASCVFIALFFPILNVWFLLFPSRFSLSCIAQVHKFVWFKCNFPAWLLKNQNVQFLARQKQAAETCLLIYGLFIVHIFSYCDMCGCSVLSPWRECLHDNCHHDDAA